MLFQDGDNDMPNSNQQSSSSSSRQPVAADTEALTSVETSDAAIPSLPSKNLLSRKYWCDMQRLQGTFDVSSEVKGPSKWDHRSTTQSGLHLELYSRKLPSKEGLSEYLAPGTLPLPWEVFVAINIDVEHRPTWDTSTVSVDELPSDDGFDIGSAETAHCRRLHWKSLTPAISTKRDYIFEQRIYNFLDDSGLPMMCVESLGLDVADGARLRPVESDVTRVDDWYSHLLVWPSKDRKTTRMTLLYYENPKLSLPNWVISKMIASGVPPGVGAFAEAGKTYPTAKLRIILDRFGTEHAGPSDDDGDGFYSCNESEDCYSVHSEARSDYSSSLLSRRRLQSMPWWFPNKKWLKYIMATDFVTAICQVQSAADALIARLSSDIPAAADGDNADSSSSSHPSEVSKTACFHWTDVFKTGFGAALSSFWQQPPGFLVLDKLGDNDSQNLGEMFESAEDVIRGPPSPSSMTSAFRGAPESADHFI